MNLAKRILDEMTSCASIGTVDVGRPTLVGQFGSSNKRRSIYKKPKSQRPPVKENMTADIAPTLVGVAPELMAKRRYSVNRPLRQLQKKKSAVESILGENENKSLIPDDADDLLSSAEQEAVEKSKVEVEIVGHEDLLEPALALVAPDTTPNATRELDPSLVPNRDATLDTVLGRKPVTGPSQPDKKSPAPLPVTKAVESKSTDQENLPGGDMPRPPGDFFRPIGSFTGESSDSQKVELVVGSSQSIVGSALTEGELGAASMPQPREGNIDRTMNVFRRFHKI